MLIYCFYNLDMVILILQRYFNIRQRRRSGVFNVNLENISHLFLVFLLLTLNK